MSTFGIQRLVDADQRYFKAQAAPVYLRVKNFVDNPIVEDLGLSFTPTSAGIQKGTADVLIDPPPSVATASMHTIGMAAMAGVQLRTGAKKLVLSHTWVEARQKALGYATPEQVFTDSSVVGIVAGNLLLQIVQYKHQDAFGSPVTWILLCNSSEQSRA